MESGSHPSQSGDTLQELRCPICPEFCVSSWSVLLGHLHVVHIGEQFVISCGINGCTSTQRTYSGLYSHIYRLHSHVLGEGHARSRASLPSPSFTVSNIPGPIDDSSFPEDIVPHIDRLLGTDTETMKRATALFILKLKETRMVSQATVNDVVEGNRGLVKLSVTQLQAGVHEALANYGINPDEIPRLNEVFTNYHDPFDGLETQYRQEVYFRDHFGLVEPTEIKLGESRYEPHFSGSKRRLIERYDSFQYIPLLQSLAVLLKDPSVVEQIENCESRIHQDGILEDYCDGEVFNSHPLFPTYPQALQIISYYDELEVCNPLGSYVKKHKMGIVYFTLGNIHPKYRSVLRTINLVSVANVTLIQKYGIDLILQPFVNDLNHLTTNGVTVSVSGASQCFKGALLAFLADTLGSHEVGGFKLSMSWAYGICRTCMATSVSAKVHFNSGKFNARSTQKHLDQCELLHGVLEQHYSKVYGINRRSVLLDVKHFPLVEGGLPHDLMHDIFEGVLQYETKLLILHLLSANCLTLAEFNDRLLQFDYGYTEQADKPTPITSRLLHSEDRKIRQSASQMVLLTRILPFLVGDKVPEDDLHWQCYLLLINIAEVTLAPLFNKDMVASLKVQIE